MKRAGIKIKKDYVPKAKRLEQQLQIHKANVLPSLLRKVNGSKNEQHTNHTTTNYTTNTTLKQKCPQCNQLIPVDELEHHMRIELLDPKWKQQKERELGKKRESNLTAGGELVANLKRFAEVRPDIFGGDEFELKQKIEEQKKKALERGKESLAWDGRYATVTRTMDMANYLASQPEKQQEYIQQQLQEQAKQVGPRLDDAPELQQKILQQSIRPRAYGGYARDRQYEQQREHLKQTLEPTQQQPPPST